MNLLISLYEERRLLEVMDRITEIVESKPSGQLRNGFQSPLGMIHRCMKTENVNMVAVARVGQKLADISARW